MIKVLKFFYNVISNCGNHRSKWKILFTELDLKNIKYVRVLQEENYIFPNNNLIIQKDKEYYNVHFYQTNGFLMEELHSLFGKKNKEENKDGKTDIEKGRTYIINYDEVKYKFKLPDKFIQDDISNLKYDSLFH